MTEHQHLDTLIKDALDEAASNQPLSAPERRALDDLVQLARTFVRFDDQQRASILQLVRVRGEQELPRESGVFFVD